MFFKRKLKPFKVHIKYEYVTSEYNVNVVTRDVTEIEFSKSKQKLYKKIKKQFEDCTIFDLEITELQ